MHKQRTYNWFASLYMEVYNLKNIYIESVSENLSLNLFDHWHFFTCIIVEIKLKLVNLYL